MTLYTNPSAGVQDLFDNERFVEQVANFYNWNRLYSNASFFTLLMNLGKVGFQNSTEVLINTDTELPNYFTGAAGNSIAIPGLDKTSSSFIDLNTFAGETNLDEFHIGDAFFVKGTSDGTGAGSDGDVIEALVRIVDISSGNVKFKTLQMTDDSTTDDVLDDDEVTVEFIRTKIDEYSNDAPDYTKFRPGKDYNHFCMKRLSLGASKVELASEATYDNSLNPMMMDQNDMLNMYIDRDILYSKTSRPAADSAFRGGTGTGGDYGIMKGIPGFLGCDDLSSSDAISSIVAAGEFDYWKLAEFAAKFTIGNSMKWAICSPSFSVKLAKVALESMDVSVANRTIEFPRFTLNYKQYTIGPITFNVIIDRNLARFTPVISDGTNTVDGDQFMFVVDDEFIELLFFDLKANGGIMSPKLVDLRPENQNGTLAEKYEWRSMPSMKMSRIGAHGVFGVAK